MQKISIRKCRYKDLIPGCILMQSAVNNLRRQTGKQPERWKPGRVPPPLVAGVFKTDRDTMYCAWKNGKIVGFAGAYVRGKQWYLCWLFVKPNLQDKGVGRKLLERVWRESKGMTHSLCTFAYNPQAVGLYSRFGMAPLCDLPQLKAEKSALILPEKSKLEIKQNAGPGDLRWIHGLEKKIRGYSHPQHWDIWRKQETNNICIAKKRGKRIGYFMIINNAWIAPLGVTDKRYIIDVMTEALLLIEPKKDHKISVWCPTLNLELYTYLIRIGFRVGEYDIYMSDKPYLDWNRYVPATLAVI